jgi:hypothetical protein
MVFIATFNNISVIWWWSVLLVKETALSGKKHRLIALVMTMGMVSSPMPQDNN